MMKIYSDRQKAVEDYKTYIRNHIHNVSKGWKDLYLILIKHKKEMLEFVKSKETHIRSESDFDNLMSVTKDLIKDHDSSKYSMSEFIGYRKHFYPYENDIKIDGEYDSAWNHHQKSNTHHWQYWILIKDDGSQIVLDMPLSDIFEMLSDWRSFVYGANSNSSANIWYQSNKDKIMISDNTRSIVEYILSLDDKF